MLLSVVLATISVAATVNVKSSDSPDNDISPAGCYALYVAFILLFYTVIPLPLYAIVLVSVIRMRCGAGLDLDALLIALRLSIRHPYVIRLSVSVTVGTRKQLWVANTSTQNSLLRIDRHHLCRRFQAAWMV